MKKLVSLVLAVLTAASCLFIVSCDQTPEEAPTVSRSFIAGYEKAAGEQTAQESGRILMNLWSDGKLDIYVGYADAAGHKTAQYSGTYSLGENTEFDETITFTYTYGDGASETVTAAVIIDGIFEAPFHLISAMTPNAIKFYETAPASTDGDVYVGYLTKTGGMGAMVYAYSLCLKENGIFDVSIMQMASVMHVLGGTDGTYTVDGENITFSYDVVSESGELVTADYTSEGTGYSETALSAGFNISQTSVHASAAPFIRVK